MGSEESGKEKRGWSEGKGKGGKWEDRGEKEKEVDGNEESKGRWCELAVFVFVQVWTTLDMRTCCRTRRHRNSRYLTISLTSS